MIGRNARITALGMTIAIAALAAGCSEGANGHQAGSAPSSSPPTTEVVGSTRTTRPGTAAAASGGGLAELRQEIDAAGTTLGGAEGALGQSDPNQTKSSEGTAP